MYPVVEFMAPLVSARRRVNLTQTDIANRIGVSKQTIGNLEAGRVSTRLHTIAAYAELFNMKMDIVFTKQPEE